MERKSWRKKASFDEYRIIQQSAIVLPVWKVLVSWGAMLGVYFLTTEVIRYELSHFFFTGGMLLILGVQYGFAALPQFFGPLRKGTRRWISVYLVLSYFLTVVIVALFHFSDGTPHVSIEAINQLPLSYVLLDVGLMTVSLIGEEVAVAILAFPIFGWLNQVPHLKRWAFFSAALLSSLIFGGAHLPAYEWNWFQCIFVVGLPRIFYTYAWRKSDSLWAGFWIHAINNWIAYGLNYIGKPH